MLRPRRRDRNIGFFIDTNMKKLFLFNLFFNLLFITLATVFLYYNIPEDKIGSQGPEGPKGDRGHVGLQGLPGNDGQEIMVFGRGSERVGLETSPWTRTAATASTSPFVNLITTADGLAVGTSTMSFSVENDLYAMINGSTTIRTPVNSLRAFRVLNSAYTSLLTIDTVNSWIQSLSTTTVGTASSTPSQEFVVTGDQMISNSGTTTLFLDSTTAGNLSCIQMESTQGPVRVYIQMDGTTVTIAEELGSCK